MVVLASVVVALVVEPGVVLSVASGEVVKLASEGMEVQIGTSQTLIMRAKLPAMSNVSSVSVACPVRILARVAAEFVPPSLAYSIVKPM